MLIKVLDITRGAVTRWIDTDGASFEYCEDQVKGVTIMTRVGEDAMYLLDCIEGEKGDEHGSTEDGILAKIRAAHVEQARAVEEGRLQAQRHANSTDWDGYGSSGPMLTDAQLIASRTVDAISSHAEEIGRQSR